MIVIVSKILPKGILGITLFPFIILKKKSYKENQILMNHEKIHLRQQLELLVIPFYIWYLLAYLFNLMKYKNKNKAYRNIIFEKEAYSNEADLEYLKNRKWFGFI